MPPPTLTDIFTLEREERLSKQATPVETQEGFSSNNQEDQSEESPQSNLTKTMAQTSGTQIQKEARRKSFEAFLAAKAWLETTFSKAFNFKNPKPLKQGIRQELFEMESPLSRTQIRQSIHAYINSKAYLESILREEWRVDLSREKSGRITKEHKEHAAKKLEDKQKAFEERQKRRTSTQDA